MEKRNDTPNGAQIEDTSASSPSNRNGAHLSDDFIMHPTNDVCFAGLMENPAVRKGFCSAILRIKPEEIEETELLPTHLHREYGDDKLGILDVYVRLRNGIQINTEMQVKKFEFWNERTLFYLSKMFAEQLRKGESYEKLKSVSRSASWISSCFQMIKGVAGRCILEMMRQESSIMIRWNCRFWSLRSCQRRCRQERIS